MLAAAREVLLEEGWERVTLGRVAERSGYARTTLYRHWPQRLDLLRDLIREEARLAHTTPTGDLRDDLVAELEAFRVAVTSTGFGRVIIAIGQQARDDAELADLNRSMRAEGARVLDEIVVDGVAAGDLPAACRPTPRWRSWSVRCCFGICSKTTTPSTEYVVSVVDWFLAAARQADGGGHAGSNSFAVERSPRPQDPPRQGGSRRTNEPALIIARSEAPPGRRTSRRSRSIY